MQIKPVALKDLRRVLTDDMRKLQRHVDLAVAQTAADGRVVAESLAPEASGGLKEGIFSEVDSDLSHSAIYRGSYRIISTAPHSVATEVGSRPHTPPFDAIYAWVRLRGTQALEAGKAQRAVGPMSRKKSGRGKSAKVRWVQGKGAILRRGGRARGGAGFVGRMIRAQGIDHIDGDSGRRTRNAATPVDAARNIAWMIIRKIKREGTKPTWFMRRTLPHVKRILSARVKRALEELL